MVVADEVIFRTSKDFNLSDDSSFVGVKVMVSYFFSCGSAGIEDNDGSPHIYYTFSKHFPSAGLPKFPFLGTRRKTFFFRGGDGGCGMCQSLQMLSLLLRVIAEKG